MSTRSIVRPIVARVLAEVGTDDIPALETALRAAYPFRHRGGYALEVWKDEIQKQLKRKPKPPKADPDQLNLL